jgi:hypothetical protein
MVLPAEQMTTIAKSMLERQAKPKEVSIVDLDDIKPSGEKRRRQNSRVGVNNKKNRHATSSKEKT